MKNGKEFDGKVSEMRDSPWLASEDVLDIGGSATLTIAKCWKHENVEFEAGRTEPTVFTLEFKGAAKQMILNSVNRKSLTVLFGRDVKGWAGQKVCVYVDPNVRMMGKTVNGLRIRAAK
jgi:hypothetical protein